MGVGAFVVVAVAGSITHLVDQRAADARVLRMRTRDATHLAECEERTALQAIELEGARASRAHERDHAIGPAIGDRVLDAQVRSVSGTTAVREGQTCRVELDWNSDPIEGCRALVRCGGALLYGDVGTGFFDCTVDARGLVHGEDSNPTSSGGDPRLVVDRASSELTLSDDAPVWSITLALPPIESDPLAGPGEL